MAAGATVDFRPTGSSMVPLIRSRQLVTVTPVDPTTLEVGDIVLARVAGTGATTCQRPQWMDGRPFARVWR